MFTGIIEELGSVESVESNESGARIRIGARLVVKDTNEGDSISVNGVCLTALAVTNESFEADVSLETLGRSTLGKLEPGARVNLERAVTPMTRLGGHMVQGHVDGCGEFKGAAEEGEFRTVTIGFPATLARYFVEKGSVTVEGISLTIAALRDSEFDIAVIPKTWTVTNFATLKPGDPVNLEVDVIAKYVERLVLSKEQGVDREGITMEKLKKLGFS